ncbi:MAG TPA: VCBS repeat-containing protein [Flavisolibacter sp.]
MFSLYRVSALLVLVAAVMLGSVFVPACNDPRNSTHARVPMESINKGKELAGRYCNSCHALPDPSWLDAGTWENGVMPVMGPFLGIHQFNYKDYPSWRFDHLLEEQPYPAQPLLSREEWGSVIDYYTSLSPDKLEGQKKEVPIQLDLKQFTIEIPKSLYTQAATSFIKIRPPGSQHALLISDAFRSKTFFLNASGELKDSLAASGPYVDIAFDEKNWVVCNIGRLDPNNGRFGKAEQVVIGKDGKGEENSAPLLDSLRRPVQVTPADFNGDGRMDYLVCEFGFIAGSLMWMEGTGSGFRRHIIKALPGAIKAYVRDENSDGRPDIWVLFTQGREGVYLYTNKGNGVFAEKEVLAFPPVYGSSFFELVDVNKDGLQDVVYTCGDNADYSTVLKPYHGVYVFVNKGGNRMEQSYFYPVNGCYKALARDYDGDGDVDIATISYFADYAAQPEESFVYFENTGALAFQPRSMKESSVGRWLTMDAGDLDGDGDIDLVLGSFFMGPTIIKSKVDWAASPPFIVLRNRGKKR